MFFIPRIKSDHKYNKVQAGRQDANLKTGLIDSSDSLLCATVPKGPTGMINLPETSCTGCGIDRFVYHVVMFGLPRWKENKMQK